LALSKLSRAFLIATDAGICAISVEA